MKAQLVWGSALILDPAAGFLPGEDVAVAIIADHIVAGPDGRLDAGIMGELRAYRPPCPIVLTGRTTGNALIGGSAR